MLDDHSYATLLRPIGQMLEGLRIDSFAVRSDGNGFVVQDRTRNRAQLTPRERSFLAELHLGHTDSLDKEDALRLAAGVFEWHVTESDMERFERRRPRKTAWWRASAGFALGFSSIARYRYDSRSKARSHVLCIEG